MICKLKKSNANDKGIFSLFHISHVKKMDLKRVFCKKCSTFAAEYECIIHNFKQTWLITKN